MPFGDNLRALMKNRGITGDELGKVVGKKKSAISTWVNNGISPSIEDLIKLKDYFNINLDDLIAGSENVESLNNLDFESLNNSNLNEPESKYEKTKEKQKPPLSISKEEYLLKAIEMLQVEVFRLRERVEQLEKKK